MSFKFPVGYHSFNDNNLLNFQLNRWYSTGFLGYDELKEVGERINSFESAKKVFKELGEEAINNNQWLVGATYLRGAEFFALGRDPEKNKLYDTCMKAYCKAYEDEPILYEKVPYDKGYLPIMRIMTDQPSKGWIVLHGGYDSFIQELYPFCKTFVNKGYDVIMFEGPGQGGALNEYDMVLTHEWEKPVSKILDHYAIDDVTLIGISLGGYLAARAAAFEKRIGRVVLYDIIYDFYNAFLCKFPKHLQILIRCFLPFKESYFWRKAEEKVADNLFLHWLILQGYHTFGVHSIWQYINSMKKYHTKKISKYIDQDVLLLAGEEDIYTSFFDKQKKALTHAKSVTGRIFTKNEYASHHCQIGNIGLALDYILDWIERKR
ncbi:alpha/beta fold hydrolase [Maledivibacter halophilus]|uniref:Lysophospholipase, alpha-beta hydrolase superfamily n=1 Tax=Maledivibacter halophilus TaxID=36842 RepID=A0A1T5LBT3_9FIRM|nr:alpha/beta hydrolase [Maledivibacter halophilus]SKC73507.1 Lysophospholipase, alpha-beta hydrolase superfamily [Maledivibacter halophilus]